MSLGKSLGFCMLYPPYLRIETLRLCVLILGNDQYGRKKVERGKMIMIKGREEEKKEQEQINTGSQKFHLIRYYLIMLNLMRYQGISQRNTLRLPK